MAANIRKKTITEKNIKNYFFSGEVWKWSIFLKFYAYLRTLLYTCTQESL